MHAKPGTECQLQSCSTNKPALRHRGILYACGATLGQDLEAVRGEGPLLITRFHRHLPLQDRVRTVLHIVDLQPHLKVGDRCPDTLTYNNSSMLKTGYCTAVQGPRLVYIHSLDAHRVSLRVGFHEDTCQPEP